QRPEGERALLQMLGRFGVPVIPQILACTAQQAAAAAAQCGGPVAIRIASPDIAHKTEVSGVALNIATPEAAAAACDAMLAAVALKAPEARLDGAVVSPMRSPGVELLVGV